MEKAGAQKVTEIVQGENRENTYPIEACYILVVDHDQAFDLRGNAKFTKCADYSNPSVMFKNEIGSIVGFRVIVSSFMEDLTYLGGGAYDSAGTVQQTGSGSAARADVHTAMALGKEAFGIADLETLESIIKNEKEAGGPLNMFSTTGYILAMTAKALNKYWYVVLESAVGV